LKNESQTHQLRIFRLLGFLFMNSSQLIVFSSLQLISYGLIYVNLFSLLLYVCINDGIFLLEIIVAHSRAIWKKKLNPLKSSQITRQSSGGESCEIPSGTKAQAALCKLDQQTSFRIHRMMQIEIYHLIKLTFSDFLPPIAIHYTLLIEQTTGKLIIKSALIISKCFSDLILFHWK
jgi:hypothetical protein